MISTGLFLSKIRAALREGRLARGARLLVACSGGPDSTALLSALAAISGKLGIEVVAAYVDHGIRAVAERSAERKAAEVAAATAGRPLVTLAVEPGELRRLARRDRRSLEDVARERRLDVLRGAAASAGCSHIALGHTADDQAETLIMRFFQGSGAAGLAGMKVASGDVLRPLLRCSRAEVRAFLAEKQLSCHIDSSNADPRFLRNAVRSTLLEPVARVFPGYARALQALSRKMSGLAELVATEAEIRCPWTTDGPHSCSADAGAFFGMPPALRSAALYAALDRVAARRTRFAFGLVEALAERPPGRKYAVGLAGGLRIAVDRGRVAVSCEKGRGDIVCNGKTGYFTLVAEPFGGAVQAGPYRLVLTAGDDATPDRAAARALGRVSVQPPVVLRSRRRGDRVPTAAGTTSLKKLLNEWGVPLEARDDVAVLADARGVAAVIAWPWGARAAQRPPDDRQTALTIASIGNGRS
jgi:tRNA(Ile)-lysidine synthetase-like protein